MKSIKDFVALIALATSFGSFAAQNVTATAFWIFGSFVFLYFFIMATCFPFCLCREYVRPDRLLGYLSDSGLYCADGDNYLGLHPVKTPRCARRRRCTNGESQL